MKVQQLWTEDRAVSPVVGVALLIAITVILAAVIGGVVLGLGSSSADAPQASLQFEYNETAPGNLTISHAGGESLDGDNLEMRASGTDIDDFDTLTDFDNLSAGEEVTLETASTANDGDEFSVVWMDPNSNDESVIGKYEHNS